MISNPYYYSDPGDELTRWRVEWLWFILTMKGLTLKQAAAITGVGEYCLSRILHNMRPMSDCEAREIALSLEWPESAFYHKPPKLIPPDELCF